MAKDGSASFGSNKDLRGSYGDGHTSGKEARRASRDKSPAMHESSPASATGGCLLALLMLPITATVAGWQHLMSRDDRLQRAAAGRRAAGDNSMRDGLTPTGGGCLLSLMMLPMMPVVALWRWVARNRP